MRQILNTHLIHLYKRDSMTPHQGKVHYKEAMRNLSKKTLMPLAHLPEIRPKLTALTLSNKRVTIILSTVVQKNHERQRKHVPTTSI